MYQYANGYSCAIDTEGEEVVLCFRQKAPTYDETGKISSVETEQVASIVMNRTMAKDLGESLLKLTDGDSEDEDGVPTEEE